MSAYAQNLNRAPRTLTEREQLLLLKTTGQHRSGFRDHVIFSVALATGLREHEIIALNVGDLFDEQGKARRRVQLTTFKRSDPDVDTQEILLSEPLRAKLEKLYRWKKGREALAPDSPVFISQRKRRLSARQLRHSFRVWQQRAGFEHLFTVHQLRHTSCTAIYRATKDIRLTQRFARHKHIMTTMCYTHPGDEELLRAVQGLIC